MIKTYLNEHIKFEHIDFDDSLTYCPDGKTKYITCGSYPPNKLDSAILVCNYFKDKHFCLIGCMENVGFPNGYFNIMVLKSEFYENMDKEMRYLIDHVEAKINGLS